MATDNHPSFSVARKWSLSLNMLLALGAVVALLAMTNYLAARHFKRWSLSDQAQTQLSPLSLRVLNAVTNPVTVTLYFDKRDALYSLSHNLLKSYRYANPLVEIKVVDYVKEPGDAQLVKIKHKLGETDRDIAIFESQGRSKIVYQGELSDIDIQPLVRGESKEVRRTSFKGEAMFTSAILNVINARQPKAYFLGGHVEHNPEAEDGLMGYSRFAGVLRENNVIFSRLNLDGPQDIPADCSLLIIPGPRTALDQAVLDKINRYLKQGGRAFIMFFSTIGTEKPSGLETLLSEWGVAVGENVVIDEKNTLNGNRDFVTSTFGTHPLIKPLLHGFQLYTVLPRSVAKDARRASGADAPQVEQLLYSSDGGRILTDIRPDGRMLASTKDFIGNVSLMVAVEKGGIRNVSADRGTTRIVVTGESLFLANNAIDREGNRQFATHAINWLLARNDLLVAVPPRPMTEYKLTMTDAQMSSASWILMGALPGSILSIGGLVWLRRRR
jgi:ABC-2 type transport system permease protein